MTILISGSAVGSLKTLMNYKKQNSKDEKVVIIKKTN